MTIIDHVARDNRQTVNRAASCMVVFFITEKANEGIFYSLSLGITIISDPPPSQTSKLVPPLRSGPSGDKAFRGSDRQSLRESDMRSGSNKDKENKMENFGITKMIEDKQMKLFPDFWENVINEKKKAQYEVQLEAIRAEEDEYETFSWIKNPVVRTKTLSLDSDMNWTEVEEITHDTGRELNTKAITEVFEFEVMIKQNKDLLGIEAYDDMGLQHYEDPKYPMDKVHFNECCVQNKSHLLALFERNKLDWKKDYWLDEDWLTKNLEISYEVAQQLSIAFEQLGIDRKTINKLFHGYVSDTEITRICNKKSWKKKEFEENRHWEYGMLEYTDKSKLELIENIIEIGAQMQHLKKNDMHSGETHANYEEEGPEWAIIAENQLTDEVPDETEYEDRFNLTKDDPFGTHKLFFGEDGCSHELLTYINECDRSGLKDMKSSMFPQRGMYGQMQKAEYWYLTPSQKTQVWRYIKDREEKLDKAETINFKRRSK